MFESYCSMPEGVRCPDWMGQCEHCQWVDSERRQKPHRRFLCAVCGNDWMTVLPEIDTCQICYHRSQPDIEQPAPALGAKVYIVTARNRFHWQTLAVVAVSTKDASEKFSAYLADCQYRFDVNEIEDDGNDEQIGEDITAEVRMIESGSRLDLEIRC